MFGCGHRVGSVTPMSEVLGLDDCVLKQDAWTTVSLCLQILHGEGGFLVNNPKTCFNLLHSVFYYSGVAQYVQQ